MALTKADQQTVAQIVAQGIAAALAGMQGTVEDDSTDESTPAKGRSTKKAPGGVGRESRFTPSAVKRTSIPRRKGQSFQYAGKRGVTTWKVTEVHADGGVLAQRIK